MLKKKVIVVAHAMELGGAERAILGLLNSFDYSKYQVDLFLMRQEGDLLKFIPKEVNLLPMNQARYLAVPMKSLISKHEISMLYGRLKAKCLAKKRIKELGLKEDNQVELTYSHKYTWKYMDAINPDVEYDLAISFLTPHYICLNHVKSKKKIAWIHTDYSTIDIDVETELNMWESYNYIASISENVTEAFLQKFPILKDKIIRIDNIVTNSMVEEQADEPIDVEFEEEEHIKLLSIGRFSYAKNFDNIPEICKYILESGLNIRWYLIGFGGDEQLIRDNIEKCGMRDRVIILGKKGNPYPYIKNCDIYVQPSRYEGKAVTVREAQILQKPVIITNYATAHSQIEDGYDGVIVPLDNKECAKGIEQVIRDSNLHNKLIANMKKAHYSNESEIEKIYKMIGE
jgi:glycosyltransferase involved in cell wall biosynthesis